MRIRSFAMIGVAAAMAAGCGGAGSGSVGSFSGTGAPASGSQPPSSSDTPSSSETAPGNPNQPTSSSTPGGGAVCPSACALADKYPCVGLDLPAGDCVTQCQTALANGDLGATMDCVKASLSLFECADAIGGVTCPPDGGDPDFSDAVATACASELQATLDACNDQQQGGSCQPGVDCSGCQDACASCECTNGQNAPACGNACGTTNGGTCTQSGDQCAGCTNNCDACLCATNNDQTTCASACGG